VHRVDSSDLAVDFLPSRGSLELHVNGEAFFPRILHDIEEAQSSVHISEFEVRQGLIASSFQSLLKAKARQGVETRLIVDRIGSSVAWSSNPMFDDLADAGVQIVTNDAVLLDSFRLPGGKPTISLRFDELGHADHRKLFVIDGRVAWVGSAGIADHFSDGRFHDVFVRLEGEIVTYLQTVFLTSFRYYGGLLSTTPATFDSYYPAPAEPGSVRLTVLHNVPRERHRATTTAIADLIDHAVQRLDIVCPFTADRTMIRRIMDAARRGAQVRFVAPAHSRNWATAGAFSHFIPQLQAAGVEVWLHPVFPHAKVVLADDRALVGSTNLDAWALYRNWEIGILIEDAAFTDHVRRELFDTDVSRSQIADPSSSPLIRGKDWLLAAIGPLI
jgi:cardiolipin synthase